jgi:hypothetical protein
MESVGIACKSLNFLAERTPPLLSLYVITKSPQLKSRKFATQSADFSSVTSLWLLGVDAVPGPIAVAANVEDGGVMEQPVHDGSSHDLVSEDLAAVREAAVGGEHDGPTLVAATHHLKDPVRRGLRSGVHAREHRGTSYSEQPP